MPKNRRVSGKRDSALPGYPALRILLRNVQEPQSLWEARLCATWLCATRLSSAGRGAESPNPGLERPAGGENPAIALPSETQDIAGKIQRDPVQFAAAEIEDAGAVEPAIRRSDTHQHASVFADGIQTHVNRGQAQSTLKGNRLLRPARNRHAHQPDALLFEQLHD